MLTKLVMAAVLAPYIICQQDAGVTITDHKHLEEHHHLIAEKCLSKTEAFGAPIEGVSTGFDQTSAIAENLLAHAKPYEWNICLDSNQSLTSIALSFIDVSDDKDGLPTKTIIKLPRAGPETGSCFSKAYGDRKFADKVRIFKLDNQISGVGV